MAEVKKIRIIGEVQSGPVYRSTTIEAGAIIAKNATGFIVEAADTAGLVVVGVARETVDNSTGNDGDKTVEFEEGIFECDASSITQAMWKGDLYIVNEYTVDETTSNYVWAGKLYKFISTTKCWIDLRMHLCPAVAAGNITFTPTGTIAAVNAQAAIAEVATDAAADLTTYLGGGTSRKLTVLQAWYDFATHGGAQGAIAATARGGATAFTIPDNFIPVLIVREQEIAFTSAGSATVKEGVTGNDNLITAVQAFNHAQFAINTAAAAAEGTYKVDGADQLLVTVATADLTAGRVNYYILGFAGA